MGVAILGRATLNVWLGNIICVDENGATCAGVVTARASTTAKSNDVVLLLVGADSVGTSGYTLGNVHPSNILLDVEGLGILGVKLEKLLHVEELDAVTDTLRANDEGILQDLHLAPDDGVILGRQTTKVLELTLLGDLGERSTVSLTDSNKFAALVGPSPGTGTFTDSVTELGVRLEVVHVNVLAAGKLVHAM
jgi:hypothetical protein